MWLLPCWELPRAPAARWFQEQRSSTPDRGALYDDARRVAGLKVPVLILGERGTGKTTLASWIRFRSPFRKPELDTAWPAVPCGQYSPETMRAELFGYVAGAFTDAKKDRLGLLERANGDTLFLDEIGDVSKDLQRLLIKVLEEGVYQPLGSTDAKRTDLRLLTATNLAPDALREQLDADFLDRIRAFTLTVPPLREVPEELDWLWPAVLEQAAARARAPVRYAHIGDTHHAHVLRALRAHPLPGNVRDLFRVAWRFLAARADDDAPLTVRMPWSGSPRPSVASLRGAHSPPRRPWHRSSPNGRARTGSIWRSSGTSGTSSTSATVQDSTSASRRSGCPCRERVVARSAPSQTWCHTRGDWEHRTLRSIQPSRILARQIEDEWNLYENRVAVRLVDNLLAYLAKRLEELRKIKEILDASRDHSDELRQTSFRRARRITELWSNTLEAMPEKDLSRTMQRLELAQRDLQNLLDAPLYRNVPRRQAVALSLKPTNILVNDPHYRKVAALWRAWLEFGHKRQETHQQRADRRQREAADWDRFVLHLVARAFASLGWTAARNGSAEWNLTRDGWSSVAVVVDKHGVVSLRARGTLRLLPLCASFVGVSGQTLASQLEAWDALEGELVAVHVGAPADLADIDRATGWSFHRRAVMFGCSPWGIDSEERMARLLNGWLNRTAVPAYPVTTSIQALPDLPRGWGWLRYEGTHLVALRAPDDKEAEAARTWASTQTRELSAKAELAKLARQVVEVAPREAVATFQRFIGEASSALAGIELCPVCEANGLIKPRPGRNADGSDATWWATCSGCRSEWGLRPCTSCGERYRALVAQGGIDISHAAGATPLCDWPDKVFGRDLWTQPCSTGPLASSVVHAAERAVGASARDATRATRELQIGRRSAPCRYLDPSRNVGGSGATQAGRAHT